jgi:uncharacterized protein (TIGR00251 family)
LTEKKDHLYQQLNVKVTPNAARDEITGFTEGVLNVKIAAPPEKGKANKKLIDFLSDRLGVSKSSIRLIRGQTSRRKVIAIDGLSRDEVIRRISA